MIGMHWKRSPDEGDQRVRVLGQSCLGWRSLNQSYPDQHRPSPGGVSFLNVLPHVLI